MFSELIKEQQGLIAVEKLGGNVVKEEFHKGAMFGLRLAEGLVESARQNAAEGEKTPTNKPSAPLPDFTMVYDAVKEWYDSAPEFAMPSPADIAKFTYDFIAGNS